MTRPEPFGDSQHCLDPKWAVLCVLLSLGSNKHSEWCVTLDFTFDEIFWGLVVFLFLFESFLIICFTESLAAWSPHYAFLEQFPSLSIYFIYFWHQILAIFMGANSSIRNMTHLCDCTHRTWLLTYYCIFIYFLISLFLLSGTESSFVQCWIAVCASNASWRWLFWEREMTFPMLPFLRGGCST